MARKSTTANAPETVQPAPERQAEQPEQITIVGNLVRTPVLRHTETSGKPVTNIRVAVNHEDAPAEYHNVVVWGRTAEVVCEFLKKGRRVEVIGRTQQREYKPQDGDARQITEIVARSVQFLDSPRREQQAAAVDKEVA